jgi:Protease inhibitor Inh
MPCRVPDLRYVLQIAAVSMALALGGCASSQRLTGPYGTERLDGPGRVATAQPGAVYNAPPGVDASGPGVYATAPITSQPLPPPEPRYGTSLSPQVATPGASAPDPLFSPIPEPAPVRQPTTLSAPGRVATLGEISPSGPRPANTRDGLIGKWTAREANGTSCQVQLSNAPALDRYKAAASSCANKDLQKATTWDYQDGEVYLYQPGGNVVARLKASDGSAMSGVVAKSGANLSLSR